MVAWERLKPAWVNNARAQNLVLAGFVSVLGAVAIWLVIGALRSDDAAATETAELKLATPAEPAAPAEPVPLVSGPIPAAEPGEAALITDGPPVNKVALTFDDGLCSECIYGVLEILDRTGAAATMFPNGIYADRWNPNVDLSLDLVARGQIEFGNHSYGHEDLRTLKRRDIARDLRRNEEWIWKTFQTNPRPLMRPPFGAYDDDVIDVAGRRGYTQVVTWSSSGLDWELVDADAIANSVRDTLKPGAIILLHLNTSATVDALPAILEEISDRGLEPVLLSELLAAPAAS